MKTAFRYVWSIAAGVVFFVATQSITQDGPSGAPIFGYVLTFLYVIFRWNISQKRIEIRSKPLIWLIRTFVIFCSLLIFAGLSGMHGGSEAGKIFAAVIALIFAVEAGSQNKRVSTALIGVR